MPGWAFASVPHPIFARWACRELRHESWDVIHAWTGVAEEIYNDPAFRNTLKIVMRGSAHIETQATILQAEQKRVGCPIDQPRRWIVEREQREYRLTDRIIVLSTFAFN